MRSIDTNLQRAHDPDPAAQMQHSIDHSLDGINQWLNNAPPRSLDQCSVRAVNGPSASGRGDGMPAPDRRSSSSQQARDEQQPRQPTFVKPGILEWAWMRFSLSLPFPFSLDPPSSHTRVAIRGGQETPTRALPPLEGFSWNEQS